MAREARLGERGWDGGGGGLIDHKKKSGLERQWRKKGTPLVPLLLLLQGRRRPILERKPKPQPSKPSHPICPSIISSWQSSADLAQLCYGDGGKGKRLFLATHSHPHRRRLALIFRDAQSEDSFVPTNSKRMPEEEGVLVMTLPFVFEARIRRKRTVKRYVRSKESLPPARPSLLISFPSPLFPSSAPPPRL